MSHEPLAQLWATLRDLHNLSVALRDAVGKFILQACRSEYHQLETPQRFLEYALELGAAFDVIRFTARLDPQTAPSLQEDIVAAVAHFLLQTANDFGTSKSLLTDEGYIHVLGQTLAAAVCTLRLCAWNCRLDLKTAIYRASNKVLTNAPATDIRLWFIQSLAHFLSDHYGPYDPVHTGFDRSEVDWSMLWSGNSDQRLISISELVERATDIDIATVERVLPLLELCQLYWDTDALLIQAGTNGPRQRQFSKFFHVSDDLTAIHLALEVRFAIQERLTSIAIHRNTANDSLKTQAHILFRPGLSLPCSQDLCSCSFHPRLAEQILGMRYRMQSDVVRADIAKAYANCPTSQFPADFFNRAYRKFDDRLRRPILRSSVASDENLPHSASLSNDRLTDGKDVTAPLKSVSSPKTSPQYPRPQPLIEDNSKGNVVFSDHRASATEAVNRTTVDAEVANLHINAGTSPSIPSRTTTRPTRPTPFTPVSYTPTSPKNNLPPRGLSIDHESIPNSPKSDPRSLSSTPRSPGPLTRADSSTTATSSSRPNTQSADSYVRSLSYNGKIAEETLPEAVTKPVQPVLSKSEEEKVYPKVVTISIADIEPDGLSLFSDRASGDIAARSVYAGSNRKWSLFKSTRKPNSAFAIPKVQFFAGGKYIIAWNKYGAGIYDLCNEESIFTPVHIPDIVMAAAGSDKYALVTRTEEGFLLAIYGVNQAAPIMRIGMKVQPAAIAVSRDDRYVAVKYTPVVKIIDLQNNSSLNHPLPRDEGKIGPCGHSVAFAHDSTSFMASTRIGPERVHTYWSYCIDPTKAVCVQSSAPCGHVDDHGLSSLHVCGPSLRNMATGFLTTFTEKGQPTVLAMNQNSPARVKPVPDSKGLMGNRIQSSAMHVDDKNKKAHVVLVNQSNDVFWITNVFGSDQEVKKVRSLKRPKGMKPEVLVSMTSAEEANVFWVEKGSNIGMLFKVGKGGGLTKPVELRLDCEPLCGM